MIVNLKKIDNTAFYSQNGGVQPLLIAVSGY